MRSIVNGRKLILKNDTTNFAADPLGQSIWLY